VLYAFVSSGKVLYVGKTTMPLGKRMYGYQRPGPVSVQTLFAMLEFGTGSRQGVRDVSTRCERRPCLDGMTFYVAADAHHDGCLHSRDGVLYGLLPYNPSRHGHTRA
jgi:hypothetical protein